MNKGVVVVDGGGNIDNRGAVSLTMRVPKGIESESNNSNDKRGTGKGCKDGKMGIDGKACGADDKEVAESMMPGFGSVFCDSKGVGGGDNKNKRVSTETRD